MSSVSTLSSNLNEVCVCVYVCICVCVCVCVYVCALISAAVFPPDLNEIWLEIKLMQLSSLSLFPFLSISLTPLSHTHRRASSPKGV